MEWIILCGVILRRVALRSFGGVFGTWNLEVDDDRLLAAANDYGLHRLIFAGVQLLMRHVGRDIDEVSRASFIDEFQMISPAKAGAAAHDVDHGFEFPMVMGTSLRVGMYKHRSRPELLRADSGT